MDTLVNLILLLLLSITYFEVQLFKMHSKCSNFKVGSNQGNYFENATACSKHTLKAILATQLSSQNDLPLFYFVLNDIKHK